MNSVMDNVEKIAIMQTAMYVKYYNLVDNWAKQNNVTFSEHAKVIAVKILGHRDGAYKHEPSSFIKYFLENNFRGVMQSMDDDIKNHLFNIYRVWYNVDSYHIKQEYDEAINELTSHGG